MKVNKRITIIAVLLAVITTLGLYYYIQSIKSNSEEEFVEVYVAEQDIPAKTQLDETMIVLKKIDAKYVVNNAILKDGNILGKYATEKIIGGEQIVSDRLLESNNAKFSYQIPEDMRAISIGVNGIDGVAHLIKPGDYVDVLVYKTEEEKEENYDKVIYPNIAKVVFQNVLVLAIDQDNNNTIVNNANNENNTESQDAMKIVTFALSPSDSEKLFVGDLSGKIRLALRNPDYNGAVDTSGAIMDDIIPKREEE